MAIIALPVHVHLIQDYTKDTASGLIELFLDLLGKAVADGIALDDKHCTVTALCGNSRINDTAKRGRIHDHIVKGASKDIQDRAELFSSEKLTGIWRYRSGKGDI